MIIRPMELPDVSEVAEVYLETVQKSYKKLVATHLLPSKSSKGDLIEFYTSFVWVDSQIFVADNWDWIHWFCRIKERPRKTCEIAQLYVMPHIQWRWVWKKFISYLDDAGRYQKLKLLVIEWNKSAIDFYHQVWFVATWEKKYLPQFWVQELEFERIIKKWQK